MRRYRMTLIVRQSEELAQTEEAYHGEWSTKIDVTATSEFNARRMAMERCWGQGMLVSHFRKVIVGGTIA